MALKDQLVDDLSIFFDTDEFGEEGHRIGGESMGVIEDVDRLKYRSKVEYEGVAVGDILIYVRASEFSRKPRVGAKTTYDNRPVTVFDIREDKGIYEITFQSNEV